MEAISVSVKDAAAISGLSRSMLYNKMNEGALRFGMVGRRRLVNVESLRALVAGSGQDA